MKSKLIKITDDTMQELLNSEIVLPSSYFNTFDKNSKTESVKLDDEKFEQEVEDIIVEEFQKINLYMKRTIQSIELLSTSVDDAKEAIETKDEEKLSIASEQIENMKSEIQKLQGEIYKDPLTKLNNRKWISYRYLNEDSLFQNDGIMVLIEIKDLDIIKSKFGEVIADSAVLYLSKFLMQHLKDEMLEFNLVRYGGNQFTLLINGQNEEEVKTIMNNLRIQLSNATLKSKSGKRLKLIFCFGYSAFYTNDRFFNTLEKADELLKEDKFQIDNGSFTY